MKKNLGKILPLFLLFTTTLFAQTLAKYHLSANKTKAYVKEAVEITFKADQLDHRDVMFFFVTPKKSDDYEIKLLNKKTTELSYHNYTTTFTYILFPLKAKELRVAFDFTIKVASDEAVAQVYTGSRDNVKWIDTEDTNVTVPPLKLQIKQLPQPVDLVGDFTLKSKINTTTINQYESLHLLYTLKGKGYKDNNITLLHPQKDVTLFSEINDAYSKLTKDGYLIHREYIYALSSEKDFTIEAISLKAYSPKLQKFYTLTTPSYKINVEKIDTSTLLDDKESPNTQPFIRIDTIKELFIYLLIFGSGYLSALIQNKKQKKIKQPTKYDDITQSNSPHELIVILLNRYNIKELEPFIKELEMIKYKRSSKTFKEVKKEILTTVVSKQI